MNSEHFSIKLDQESTEALCALVGVHSAKRGVFVGQQQGTQQQGTQQQGTQQQGTQQQGTQQQGTQQ